MSTLILSCVREVKTLQVSIWEHGHLDLFEYHHLKQISLIEIVTAGWSSGSRVRQKRFSSTQKTLQYLSKLHIGGWMTEDSYDQARNMVIRLNETLEARDYEPADPSYYPMRKHAVLGIEWETFPYNFGNPQCVEAIETNPPCNEEEDTRDERSRLDSWLAKTAAPE